MTEVPGEGADGPSGPPEGSFSPPVDYAAVFQAAPDGILIVDQGGIVRDVNPQVEQLLGYSREELLGSPVERLVPPDARAEHPSKREGFMEGPTARPMGVGLELRALRKDGLQLPVEVSLRPYSNSLGRFVITVVRDVSERNRLRRLGAGTIQAVEEERRRIARELHDDSAQRLAALLLRLRLLEKLEDSGERDRVIQQVQDELSDAVEGLSRISRGLRPPALADVGLEAAIRSHLRGYVGPHALNLELELEPVGSFLGEDAQLSMYRVIQEAVSNVARHAEASWVRVTMSREGEEIVARIEDDGRGFDPERAFLDGAGLGLVGMDERARLAGGRLMIRSRAERGTRVELRLPIQEGAHVGGSDQRNRAHG
jgi:PAS domain S-box-containing protein